jgi:hypothetical protein
MMQTYIESMANKPYCQALNITVLINGEFILISWVPFYFFYVNDLPQFVNKNIHLLCSLTISISISILFIFPSILYTRYGKRHVHNTIYNTSILLTHSNTTDFNSNIYRIFETINTWVNNNYRSLNLIILIKNSLYSL